MISEGILGNINQIETDDEIVNVPFEWFEVEKKRIAKVAEDGTQIGVICTGNCLNDGDILAKENHKLYVVKIKPSHLIQIDVTSMKEMGRLCFELGNRHLSLKIDENAVYVPFDEPTFLYLKKLGFHASSIEEVFTNFIECKAHGASQHAHDHAHPHAHDHNHPHEHPHEHPHPHHHDHAHEHPHGHHHE